MVLANITGFDQFVVVVLVAAVPVLAGFVVGRWWALLLSLTPVAFGYLAYRDREGWGLMVLYVLPAAVLLALGVTAAKLRARHRRRAPTDIPPL